MTVFVFQSGETISLALDAVAGDVGAVSALSAHLRALPPGRRSLAPDAPLAAAFTVTDRAALGDDPAGWTLTIGHDVSASLPVGQYLADARLVVGSGVVVTEPVTLRLVQTVTVP